MTNVFSNITLKLTTVTYYTLRIIDYSKENNMKKWNLNFMIVYLFP